MNIHLIKTHFGKIYTHALQTNTPFQFEFKQQVECQKYKYNEKLTIPCLSTKITRYDLTKAFTLFELHQNTDKDIELANNDGSKVLYIRFTTGELFEEPPFIGSTIKINVSSKSSISFLDYKKIPIQENISLHDFNIKTLNMQTCSNDCLNNKKDYLIILDSWQIIFLSYLSPHEVEKYLNQELVYYPDTFPTNIIVLNPISDQRKLQQQLLKTSHDFNFTSCYLCRHCRHCTIDTRFYYDTQLTLNEKHIYCLKWQKNNHPNDTCSFYNKYNRNMLRPDSTF